MELATEPPSVYVRGSTRGTTRVIINSDDETLNKLCKLEEDTLVSQSFQKRKFSAACPLYSVCVRSQAEGAVCEADVSPPGRLWA